MTFFSSLQSEVRCIQMKVYCLPRTTLNLALLGFQAFLRRSSLRKQHPYFLISEDPRLIWCTWAGSLNRDWQFCQLWITIGGNNQMVGMATKGSVYNQVSAHGSAWNSAWHDVIWLQDIGSSQSMNFCENFIQLQKYIIKLHIIILFGLARQQLWRDLK